MTPYYESGGITIYHGDCREVMPTLGIVDHIITDPPFTQRTSENARSGGPAFGMVSDRTISFDGIDGQEMALTALFLARAARWVLIFCALEQIGRYADAAAGAWIRGTVWHRTNSAPQFTGDRPGQSCEGLAILHARGKKRWNRGGTSLFYEGQTVNSIADKDRGIGHPTPKPEWLMRALVSDFTDRGETVLDPFMGSGTTLVAAKRLGRQAIGIEREEKYCEIAAQRLAQDVLPWRDEPTDRPLSDGELFS